MATYYVDSGSGVLQYSNRTWTVGELMVPALADASTNYLVCRQWVWECTTGGTSSAIPTWAATVTDNVTTVTEAGGVVWTARSPDNKTHAMPGLLWLLSSDSNRNVVAGDTILVNKTHSITYSRAVELYCPGSLTNQQPIRMLCIDFADDSLSSGAAEHCGTGDYNFKLYNSAYIHGFTFSCGTGYFVSISIGLKSSGNMDNSITMDRCILQAKGGVIAQTQLGSYSYTNGGGGKTVVKNTEFFFTNSQDSIGFGELSYSELSNIVLTGATVSYAFGYSETGAVCVRNSDLRNCSNLIDVSRDSTTNFTFLSCLIPTNINTSTHTGIGGFVVECYSCGSATNETPFGYYYLDGSGVISSNTGVYLTTGGATVADAGGTETAVSLMMVASANANQYWPLCTEYINVYIPSTGSKTFSIKLANTAGVLKDIEAWLEVEFMGNAAHCQTSMAISAPAVGSTNSVNVLSAGSNLTDTAEAWTGITGEYTHTLSKTVTVNQIGWARARVCLAKPSTTIYVNPAVAVS